jgi:hypothetical protein
MKEFKFIGQVTGSPLLRRDIDPPEVCRPDVDGSPLLRRVYGRNLLAVSRLPQFTPATQGHRNGADVRRTFAQGSSLLRRENTLKRSQHSPFV